MDRAIALEALCALCNSCVTSFQKQGFHGGAASQRRQMCVKDFICTVLDADETCPVSRSNFVRLQSVLQGYGLKAGQAQDAAVRAPTDRDIIIDEDEFFDPQFDYDFRSLTDNETYYRGGEVYERPYGWYRFALKVLDKYDENAWLGTRYRSTQSVPGEWPVSYHGTSKKGAEGIISGYYKPGAGQAYGRGIYSTPYIDEAVYYTKTFTSNSTGKTYQVVLQNRINAVYRQKHNNDKYWLVPISAGTSPANEQDIVEMTIRPYGLLLKEV
ncbi:uncharacterized protein LOC133981853 [Scomber scombrus]|uniref:uncharacterized protein LOC133981853 n=1 Tax=Scomber scombrus TaxID=13677 RepID=UPI002DD79ED4|nr:uncharacterized protein LOC133981853 [Scomber scombrus]